MIVGKRWKGFTLIELLVTIALITILATVAIPSFQNMVIRNRLTTDFNQVLTAIHYARSEAAKKRGEITVVLTPAASGAGWGLEVWKGDGSVSVSCPSDDNCLKVINESPSPVTVSITPASGKVTFNALGRAPVSCPAGAACSVSMEHSSLQGETEILKINSLGNIYRPGA